MIFRRLALPVCNRLLASFVAASFLLTSIAAEAETSFSYEAQGSHQLAVDGSGGGSYEMTGKFHITLVHSESQGEMIVLDFASKTADVLVPGEYSIGMFGKIYAGIEIRSSDRFTEFDATNGSLIIESDHDGDLKGSFELKAENIESGDVIEVSGGFNASPIDPAAG